MTKGIDERKISNMKKIQSKHLEYFSKLYPFIFSDKKTAIILFSIKFIYVLVGLLPPMLYQYYINNVVKQENLNKMVYVVSGYLGFFGLQSLLTVAVKYTETKLINNIKINLKQSLLNIYSAMKYSDYEKVNIGEIRLLIESDTNAICTFYINHCVDYFLAILYSLIVTIILFCMNQYLTIFGCIMIILSYFITKVLGEKIKSISDKYRTDQGEFDATMYEGLQNWKEIKLNNLETKEVELLSGKWSDLSKSILKRTKYEFLHGALIAFNLFFVTRMNLYFFGGLLIIGDLMSVPTMLVFMNYYEQLYSNIQVILNSTVTLNTEIPQIDRVLYSLSYVTDNKEIEKADFNNNFLKGDIYLQNISFKYTNSPRYILKDINTTICSNRSLAIIGESGSGKTTLIKLLVDLYQPTNGKIYLNNIELHKIPNTIKYHYINVVMQDPQLFNMTILENLLLAKPNATFEDVVNVCKMANIHDFINSLPEGYASLIGEKGIKLSGGQKQRLTIARTLLMDPEIIIFDEATSSLDSENETAIVSFIQNLSKHKTVITISHRFSTIAKSNDIMIIGDGRIIEQGPLDEIVNESKAFASIFSERTVPNNNLGV